MGKERSLMLDDDQLNEKFASKKQQGYFYAKCGEGKTKEQKKWCRMADEFSDGMSKKDWKKLPENKKTKKSVTKEGLDENKLVSLIKEKESPRMTKKGLLEYVKNKKIVKKTTKEDMVSEARGSTGNKRSFGSLTQFFTEERGAKKELFKYIVAIRDSGIINMFGAAPLLNWTRDDLQRWLYGQRIDIESLESQISGEGLVGDWDEEEDTYEDNSDTSMIRDKLEKISYLLDNKQKIRDILIRAALRMSEDRDEGDENVQRYFERAASDALQMYIRAFI